jgi:arylsulfatase A-like enzyme
MEGHETDALTAIAIDRMKQLAEGDAPFCLFVAYQAPHPPCTPPDNYLELYRDCSTLYRQNVPQTPPGYDKPGWKAVYPHEEFTRRYFGEISHLDAAVGRLLDALDAEGLADDTAVVFTSDHGEMAGSHGLYGKGIMKEESIHVPLIVRIPNREPEITDRLFGTVDFYPTLLSLLGIDAGTEHRGVDQSSFWLSGSGVQRYAVFSEYDTREVFDGRYKLVTDMAVEKILEFYDLSEDPYERENLAGTNTFGTDGPAGTESFSDNFDRIGFENEIGRLLEFMRHEFD